MHLFWTDIYKRNQWRHGTEAERRELEIRYCLARSLRAKRQRAHLTQKQLADLLGGAQQTISGLERASVKVSMDGFIRAMIALGATDVEIAAPFNAGVDRGVQQLRLRGQLHRPARLPRDARKLLVRRWPR